MTRFDHNYHGISVEFNIPTIKSVHDQLDVVWMWRIQNGLVKSPDLCDLFKPRNIPFNLRNPTPFSTQSRSGKGYRRDDEHCSAVPRLALAWSSLPQKLRDEESRSVFNTNSKKVIFRFYED